MLNGLKDFINDANKIIRKENRKINELHREIENYNTLIYVIGQTGTFEQVLYYKEKINHCYFKIDICMENIKNSRDRIATMKAVNKIIKRGEKCA